MVILSDGKDEGSALTPGDVLRKIQANRLPIYAIGYSNFRGAERQRYLDILHRFSNLSGGVYREADTEPLPEVYAAMREAIRRVFRVKLACNVCPADGHPYPLQITVSIAGKGLQDSLEVVPSKVPTQAPPPVDISWWQKIPWWAYLLLALGIAGAGTFAVRERSQAAEPSSPVPPVIMPSSTERPPSAEAPPPTKGPVMKLIVIAGREAGRAYNLELRGRLVIGRAKDCDVVISDDARVSNRHCELAIVGGQVLLYDLSSTNRTFVNGVPIQGRHRMESQDCILVGETEFRLRMDEE
jgi:hypothetical protein